MDVFGTTRSRVARDHALITPDTHVQSPLLRWTNATAVFHISPHLGARFLQYTAHLAVNAKSAMPDGGVERFIYVREGRVDLVVDSKTHELEVGGYAFLPAGQEHEISSPQAAELIVFEKPSDEIAELPDCQPLVGHSSQVPGEPFQGDPDARLQTLLPITPEMDMAINIFTYQPGATLPQVEIHIMEHGLLMLTGMGIYRLADHYYPVAAGDIIWMASYCPQWFVAMGKEPASYLYYKDIHRDHCLQSP